MLPAAAEAPALAPQPEPEGPFAPWVRPHLEANLTVRELRSRLLAYGLSTIGVKAELRARLEYALEHERAQHQSWDADAKVWK